MSTRHKKYNVAGIGNAIVDLLAHVDDRFIIENNLQKGIMRLIGEDEAVRLHGAVCVLSEVSGGSVANSIAGIASFGGSVAFIGKVRNDRWGRIYQRDLDSLGVHVRLARADEGESTARSLVLVTPDAERTMNTYLGIANSLGPDDLDEDVLGNLDIAYLEGYLWYQEPAKRALKKAVGIVHSSGGKIALTLSDPFCVENNRAEFMNLAANHADILFANEEEIKSLFQTGSFEAGVQNCKALKNVTAITRGARGSVVVSGGSVLEVPAEPVTRIVDTTGAGDLYAAGFLHGYTTGRDLSTCARMGGIAASEVISHFGARPEISLAKLMGRTMLCGDVMTI